MTITRQPVNPGDFDLERVRNAYTLRPLALKKPASRAVAEDALTADLD